MTDLLCVIGLGNVRFGLLLLAGDPKKQLEWSKSPELAWNNEIVLTLFDVFSSFVLDHTPPSLLFLLVCLASICIKD